MSWRPHPLAADCPKCKGHSILLKIPFVTPLAGEVIAEGRWIRCDHKAKPENE